MERTRDRKKVKEYLLEHLSEVALIKAPSGGYVCPRCGSGTGKNHSGGVAQTKYGRYKCFACGEWQGDIIDYLMLSEGLTYSEALARGVVLLGGKVEGTDFYLPDRPSKGRQMHTGKVHSPLSSDAKTSPTGGISYMGYFNIVRHYIDKTSYLQNRGLPTELLRKHWIGYDSSWIHPEAQKRYPLMEGSPYVIIPTSKHSYIARSTTKGGHDRYAKMNVGEKHLFNEKQLPEGETPVFVVEGFADCLSVELLGYPCIALDGIDYHLLIDFLQREQHSNLWILALDFDERGRKATQGMIEEMEDLYIPYKVAPDGVFGDAKDANELLVKDKDLLTKNLRRVYDWALTNC